MNKLRVLGAPQIVLTVVVAMGVPAASASVAAGPSAGTVPQASKAARPKAFTGSVRVAQANIKSKLRPRRFRADLRRTYASGADVISLNEMGSRARGALARRGYSAYRDRRARGQARSTAVAWRDARWRKVASGRVRIVAHGPQRWDARRSATWATVRGIRTRRRVGLMSIVSVHHMVNPARYGPRKAKRRRLYAHGMARVAKLVRRLSARGPVFVAGDFNSQWGANDPWGPRRRLGRSRLASPVAMADTMEAFGRRPTHRGGGTVDYVFYQARRATPTTQRTVNLRSDHHLLRADFRLR